MTAPLTAPSRPVTDKRAALLAAALRLIARSGLHATPTSAIAREAGVAHGTLFLYFPSKEELLNALYLELLRERRRAAEAGVGASADAVAVPRELLWRSWHGLARWHLDHPEASRVMQQLRGSGILTAETRDAEQRARAEGLAQFWEAITRGMIRDLPIRTFWALYAGPIFALAEPADGDEEVTAAVLRATFEGVCRSVLPPDDASSS
jgi:TetR/AcrR family transcriptional regulator, repressor of fatR-cypB operon